MTCSHRARPRYLLEALAALALLAACGETPSTEGGTTATATAASPHGTSAPATVGTPVVARVVDGDTIELASRRQVRLVQIDAPEGNQGECYAGKAGAALRALLPEGTAVRLQADPRLDKVDAYGRLLRYVFKGRQNVNLTLVRRGAASVWFFLGERGRYAEALLRAARNAKGAGRGLWGACPGTRLDPLHGVETGVEEALTPATAADDCPGALSWREARAHVGERATVVGPVAGTHYAADSSGQPTFLNLGVDYPRPGRVTVLIWGRHRVRFPEPPERAYAGKTICVTGRIVLYQDVPEIEVSSPGQIEIAG